MVEILKSTLSILYKILKEPPSSPLLPPGCHGWTIVFKGHASVAPVTLKDYPNKKNDSSLEQSKMRIRASTCRKE